MAKYIIGGIFLILIAGGGYYLISGQSAQPAEQPVLQQQQPVVPTTQTYASSSFSITYPIAWTADENYKYTGVSEKKPIAGVKFTIPVEMATGTNLSVDSGVSVESLPRATSCTGDIYVLQNVKPTTMDIGGKTFSVATTTEGAAGNIYDEVVFALVDSKPCMAVRYMIHSTQLSNYPEGTVQQFNAESLIGEFNKIRDSITLGAASATPTPVPSTP